MRPLMPVQRRLPLFSQIQADSCSRHNGRNEVGNRLKLHKLPATPRETALQCLEGAPEELGVEVSWVEMGLPRGHRASRRLADTGLARAPVLAVGAALAQTGTLIAVEIRQTVRRLPAGCAFWLLAVMILGCCHSGAAFCLGSRSGCSEPPAWPLVACASCSFLGFERVDDL